MSPVSFLNIMFCFGIYRHQGWCHNKNLWKLWWILHRNYNSYPPKNFEVNKISHFFFSYLIISWSLSLHKCIIFFHIQTSIVLHCLVKGERVSLMVYFTEILWIGLWQWGWGPYIVFLKEEGMYHILETWSRFLQ